MELLHSVKLRHGADGFNSPQKKDVLGNFAWPKNPTASAGCEPVELGTKDQHATFRPPKPPWAHVVTGTHVFERICMLSPQPSLLISRSCTHNVQVKGILLSTRYSWYVPRALFLYVCSKTIFLAKILGKGKSKVALFRVRKTYRRCRAVFPNCRSAARYRALASITPGRERFSWNVSF
jgi:hypothetical protein